MPPISMLFFSSLNLILTLLSSLISPLDNYLEDYLDSFPFEVLEESRIVIEAFRTVPSGLRMLFRI